MRCITYARFGTVPIEQACSGLADLTMLRKLADRQSRKMCMAIWLGIA